MIIEDWKRVLKHAWSVRLTLISSVFSGAEVILPWYTDSVPRGRMALLSMVVAIGAGVSRLLAQKELRKNGDD